MCEADQVPCGRGPGARRECVPERWLCDGENDCGDNSDEAVEQCGQFTTTTVTIIIISLIVTNAIYSIGLNSRLLYPRDA